jgi:hypothetical protein
MLMGLTLPGYAASAPTALARLEAAGGGMILFLGNSITRHGPRPDIGWSNNWGMAATALKQDGEPVILVRSCFWAHKAKDEASFARAEQKLKHAGVAAHLGDRGMQALADALFVAFTNQK